MRPSFSAALAIADAFRSIDRAVPDSRAREGRESSLAPLFLLLLTTCVPNAYAAREAPEHALAPLDDGDDDGDGLLDAEEDELARRYAPIVILDRRDANRPASLDWLLRHMKGAPHSLFHVPADARSGADDPDDWTAYVHVYPRADGGINVQYWFFYPYNDGPLFFDHDSDWEHVTVRLDADRRPLGAHLARHENDSPGTYWSWSRLRRRGDHPVVLSALGSHATYGDASDVSWYDRAASCDDLERCDEPIWRTWQGDLPNLGERTRPLVHHDVLSYEGRWGRERVLPGTSAPFGPLHHRGFCTDGCRTCDEPGRALVSSAGKSATPASTDAEQTSHIAP